MRVGPKKKPTALKLIKGTIRKASINIDEPNPDIKIPDPPEHLSKEALTEWQRITPELFSMGLITNLDMASLASYCQAYGRWVVAERELKESGNLTIVTMQNNIIQNPLVGIANVAMEIMRKHLSNFGMSPADRAKVSAVANKEEKDSNKFASFGS